MAAGAGQFFDMIQDLGQAASDALQDALNMLMAGLPQIDEPLSDFFNAAQRYIPPRRDPLILDLDGDGLETVPPNTANPILFDHSSDGMKTGTGWGKADDGFLVLDRDGNTTIDSGRELFGDSTPLFDADGNEIGKAADGFAALTQEDTNHDGIVNTQDAHGTTCVSGRTSTRMPSANKMNSKPWWRPGLPVSSSARPGTAASSREAMK